MTQTQKGFTGGAKVAGDPLNSQIDIHSASSRLCWTLCAFSPRADSSARCSLALPNTARNAFQVFAPDLSYALIIPLHWCNFGMYKWLKKK